MTYVETPVPWGRRQGLAPRDPDLAAFVISRLAELVVVLFRDHVGHDDDALKDRAEGKVVLLALGDTAAEHGCAEWSPILHELAAMIDTPNLAHKEPDPSMRSNTTLTYDW